MSTDDRVIGLLSAASVLLSQFPLGLLPRILRWEKGLVYSVSAHGLDWPLNHLNIGASMQPAYFEEFEDVALSALDRLVKGDYPDELFDLMKVRDRIGLACQRERPNCFKMSGIIADRWLEDRWDWDPEVSLRATRQDIGQAVAQYWPREVVTVIHTLAPPAK
jgi:hypothetical protein